MSQQVAMRRRILEILPYPRQVAKANIDLSTCPHSGFFKVNDGKCQDCCRNYECDWLNSTDEFNDLAAKPMEFLYRALTFGIDFVDTQNAIADHVGNTCDCESCAWLRSAREVILAYRQGAMQ